MIMACTQLFELDLIEVLMQPFLGNMADQWGRLKFINGVQVK